MAEVKRVGGAPTVGRALRRELRLAIGSAHDRSDRRDRVSEVFYCQESGAFFMADENTYFDGERVGSGVLRHVATVDSETVLYRREGWQ